MGTGQVVVIGDGSLPPEGLGTDDPRVIRTSFLRALILGQIEGHEPHEKGVQITGAYLLGDGPEGADTRGLDLEGCTITQDITFISCRIPDELNLRSAELRNLFVSKCHLAAGIEADRLTTNGNVVLRDATINEEVRLLGTNLGGDLSLNGTKLASGPTAISINLQGALVNGAFYLRNRTQISGALDLTDARIGTITDDPACWPELGNLLLDRCRYGGFTGRDTPVDAASRIRWLSLQDEARWGAEFWPQPWEECARVLRAMGHEADARAVLIEKEKRQRKARRERRWNAGQRIRPLLFHAWDALMGLTTRYGREPLWAFAWLAGFWLLGWAIFWGADHAEALKPNNAFVLRSAEWVGCAEGAARNGGNTTQLACCLDQPEAQGYPAFNPLIYSADALLPIFDLGMQEYWVPDENTRYGQGARYYLWLHVTLGWALSLLAVAGFSGLIRIDNTT